MFLLPGYRAESCRSFRSRALTWASLCFETVQCKESGGKCFSRGGKGKVFCDPAEVMAAVAMAELASDEWQKS